MSANSNNREGIEKDDVQKRVKGGSPCKHDGTQVCKSRKSNMHSACRKPREGRKIKRSSNRRFENELCLGEIAPFASSCEPIPAKQGKWPKEQRRTKTRTSDKREDGSFATTREENCGEPLKRCVYIYPPVSKSSETKKSAVVDTAEVCEGIPDKKMHCINTDGVVRCESSVSDNSMHCMQKLNEQQADVAAESEMQPKKGKIKRSENGEQRLNEKLKKGVVSMENKKTGNGNKRAKSKSGAKNKALSKKVANVKRSSWDIERTDPPSCYNIMSDIDALSYESSISVYKHEKEDIKEPSCYSYTLTYMKDLIVSLCIDNRAISCSGVVPIMNNKVVMVYNSKGKLVLPKGLIEVAEEARDCAQREAWEEAGVEGTLSRRRFLVKDGIAWYVMEVKKIHECYYEDWRGRAVIRYSQKLNGMIKKKQIEVVKKGLAYAGIKY